METRSFIAHNAAFAALAATLKITALTIVVVVTGLNHKFYYIH